MPSWFEDHLACAPLHRWLPRLLAGPCEWIDGGARPPRGLARLLAEVPRGSTAIPRQATLVHTGPLHVPPSSAVAAAIASAEVHVVIDLAWVAFAAGWLTLRPWRREPPRRDVTGRVAWITGLGLVDPQQWTCTDPLPLIVTIGRRRG